MEKILLAVMLFIAVPVLTYGQSEQHLIAAEKLLKVSKYELSFNSVLDVMVANLVKNVKTNELNARQKVTMKEFQEKIIIFIKNTILSKEALHEMAKLYASVFTEEEINELIVFYQSPIGQKTIDKMPVLFQSSMGLARSTILARQDDLQKIIDEYSERLIKETEPKKKTLK
ncbi:MAG: DUF2059 domain-containing protein [Ignavibacteria bacterium]|nr:DUF2059 domain-containing protein [Ignavibacteria bacterium]